ncbi:MAG: hypothetical protein ACLFQV_01985 [Vulcanimicrobiota bacterium]
MVDESTQNGLKMVLRPGKDTYKVTELPVFDVLIQNISKKPVIFSTYMLKHRLLYTLMAGEFEVFPFGTTPKPPIKPRDFVTLGPGQQLKVHLDVEAEQPQYGFLKAADLPQVFTNETLLYGLPAGEYTFQAAISDNMFFYEAPENTHTYNRYPSNIYKDLAKGKINIDETKLWSGRLIAQCKITYVK